MPRKTSAEPKVILLVEDDEDIRLPVQFILQSKGYRVRAANNGKTALEVIAAEGLPDLILLDMAMPIMDGWTFAAELKKHFPTKVPVVVMTASNDAEERAKDIEATGWISKPFKFAALSSILEQYI